FDVRNGMPLSRNPSKSVKHCASGLNTMPGKFSWPQHVPPLLCAAGKLCDPKLHELPENARLNMPAYMSYIRIQSSVAFATVVEIPCEFLVPPGPPTRLIVGDTTICEISR